MQNNNSRLEVVPEIIWGPMGSQPTQNWNPFDKQRVSTNLFLQNPPTPQPRTSVGHIAVLPQGQEQSTTTPAANTLGRGDFPPF